MSYTRTQLRGRPFKQLIAILLLVFACMSSAQADRKTTYYHTDHMGTVVAASNETGALIWRKEYAPFGAQIDTTPDDEALGYTGRQHDDVTGLTYFGARYYDPYLGRFMGVDPAGVNGADPFTFNRYIYGNNNPYRFIDPNGRQAADASCDETCEYERYRQKIDSGPRMLREGASDLADLADMEASSPWNWIPVVKVAKSAGFIWTFTRKETRVENAFRHFKDHGKDFNAKNAVDYVKKAQEFLRTPPAGTLTKVRPNSGDVVRYHEASNTFGVMTKDGTPRTFYKPDPAQHGYKTNLDYFNAQ